MTTLRHSLALLLAGAAATFGATPAACAAMAPDRQAFDIPAQSLGASLRAIAAASGRDILAASTTVENFQAPAIKGTYSVEEALDLLLASTGLHARKAGTSLIIEPTEADRQDPEKGDIIVSGSRIRGGPVASPVIKQDREQIKARGQATLPDALKTVPQNFGGGQNPGIGNNVPEGNGYDLGGGSAINLRGLGSDGTLTLLNGHRLAYNAAKQSIDISVIPLGAVGRIDIVPDGASALYGSDAVAGVVNIVLRRDLDGLETGFRLAGASDGGGFTQLYTATAGRTWSSGNVLAAYEYGINTALVSNQRDFAAIRPNVVILPKMRHHSALLSFRQALTPSLTFSLDGTFARRWSQLYYPRNAAGDLSVSRYDGAQKNASWGIAPSLDLDLTGDWQLSLAANYGRDRTDYSGVVTTGTTSASSGAGYYVNRAKAIELSGNGALIDLPGGSAKLAFGGGYRQVDFRRFAGTGSVQNIDRTLRDTYAFVELSLPVVRAVTFSAAGRYENYHRVGDVVTPKFGVIVSPSSDVSLKGSWGKSFRAPTLYQQYQPQTAVLFPVASVGGTGYPAGATALVLIGGNPGVKPEKSTNWSATIELRPRSLSGFEIDLSYFSVAYRDRIVTPLPSFSVALANPLYANLVTSNPTASAQTALIASAGTFLNISGGAYNPGQVVAVVNDSNLNAGRQNVRGVDLLARLTRRIGAGSLNTTINASYLTSNQQIGPGLPVTQLAGRIFNPPHWRLRGDIGWTAGPVTLAGALTYLGPVSDNRTLTPVSVRGMTPIDFTIRFAPSDGVLKGLDVIASIQNVFNAKPARIATTIYYDSAYDSTNYSPLGRVISLSVSKKW